MKSSRALPALLLGLAALTGCTVGPNYRSPTMATPPTFAEAASTPRTTVSGGEADLSAWWTQFRDPLLTSLIDRALAGSPTLQSAQSKVREARLQETVAGAAEYPSLSATGAAARFTAPGGVQIPIRSPLNIFAVGFDASWEIDFFGATRRAVEAARADTQAGQWTLRDGEVQLAAEVAAAYLTLREAQSRIAIGETELARQKDLFTIVQQRRGAGFVTGLDVNQQSTAVETAAAQLPQLEAQASAQIHALGVLVGQPPEALENELRVGTATIPLPPPLLPLGLPSELLQRRPDIRAAERRLASANAQIGVMTANLYPKLNLLALPSLASTSVGGLFSSDSFASIALAMGSETLFDAGRNRAKIGEAKEERTQALLTWRNTFLGALRDVEDALARYRSEEARRAHLVQEVAAARSTLSIAEDQYRTGFVTFINVLAAQDALLNAQDQLAQSDASVASDLVAVYKALGGGWSMAATPPRGSSG